MSDVYQYGSHAAQSRIQTFYRRGRFYTIHHNQQSKLVDEKQYKYFTVQKSIFKNKMDREPTRDVATVWITVYKPMKYNWCWYRTWYCKCDSIGLLTVANFYHRTDSNKCIWTPVVIEALCISIRNLSLDTVTSKIYYSRGRNTHARVVFVSWTYSTANWHSAVPISFSWLGFNIRANWLIIKLGGKNITLVVSRGSVMIF